MNCDHRHRFRISEEAALWLIRLEEDDSPQCRAEFMAWSRLSPQHVEEFLLAKATVEHLGVVDPERKIDLATLAAPGDIDGVVPLRPGEASPHATSAVERAPLRHGAGGRLNWRRFVGFAASIVVAVGIVGLLHEMSPAHTYSTAAGNQQVIKLKDGSVLYLNTQSRAEVLFTERAREVKLLEGEALFVVEHDSARPFRVVAGDATIQAIGTRFNVYRHGDATRISVVEGAVRIASKNATDSQVSQIEPVKLTGGNEADVVAGKIVPSVNPNVEKAVAWRARRLVFDGDPLETVAREFNRYQSRTPIRLEGTDIRRRTVSGVFDADDPRPLVKFLEEDAELNVTEDKDEIVIRKR